MRYLDGFRDASAAAALRGQLQRLSALPAVRDRSLAIMEVCGSHTMAIARYGVRQFLPPNVRLVSGPGCPVCVTDTGYVDAAIELATRGVLLASFGDMLRVPGSTTNLAAARADGAAIHVCYSPTGALELAARHPDREVVLLAIGFETTAAPIVATLDAARRQAIGNLSLLVAFKLVPPALTALIADPELRIDGFLCPAHVSAIIGADAYRPFAERDEVPCVIAGFEPLDILYGLQGLLEQLAAGAARVDNQYSRVVTPGGNRRAQALFDTYLEPVDASWRGIGVIPASGLGLREPYADYDAARRHGVSVGRGEPHPQCRCGDVLKGKIEPPACPLFGKPCTPSRPFGPCMVSSEGTCAAHYKYEGGCA
jgi:hydrogenase expression/formation protein HypD